GGDERKGVGDWAGVREGTDTLGPVHGEWVIRRYGQNSAGLYRTGRRRPQPSVRCSKPESVGARHERADAPQRHDATLDSVSASGAEHIHMRDDPDRCPYDRGSADDVRSAFDRLSSELGSDALPLTQLATCDRRRRRSLVVTNAGGLDCSQGYHRRWLPDCSDRKTE